MEEEIQPFWSILVKPGESIKVKYPEYCFLTLTNVCLPELPPDSNDRSPIRLFAKVQTILKLDEAEDKSQPSKVLLASLIPNSSEHSQINVVFTPINEVSLSVVGNAPVQVSGILQPIFDDEEEEEEEEANEKNDNSKEGQ